MSLVEQRPRGTRDAGPEEVIRLNVKKKENKTGQRKQIRRNHEMIPRTD